MPHGVWACEMQQKKLLQLGIAGTVCAVALFAADSWKNKDYTQWTNEEIDKVLTDSPWAKQKTVTPQQSGAGQRREGGGGGMGRRGGGIGFPGGGYPGGGGGYPGGGGGGGYPGGGGGYPRGGGTRDEGGRMESMNVTLRWESALPVQHALLRQGASGAEQSKAAAENGQKYYVIAVFGFKMPGARDRQTDSDQDSRRADSKEDIRSKLLDAAQLIPKGKRAIYAEDVQVSGYGSSEVRFLFPRGTAITAGDKEVDFIIELRGIKLEHKFHLGDMQYQGQLAL